VHTDRRYRGYRHTPQLLRSAVLPQYPPVELPAGPERYEAPPDQRHQRLGKLVETYVYHQLRSLESVQWIADSLQINLEQRTVGELDALYLDAGRPVHLEVAFKFYLYDTEAAYDDPLDHWIGPNRNDTLSLKLAKLAGRQFPLLRHPAAAKQLTEYGLVAAGITQRICFKGQLFIPFGRSDVELGPLNPACVAGYHLPFEEMGRLAGHRFYIPEKLDWLVEPYAEVTWLDFEVAQALVCAQIEQGRSPMVWWRSPQGEFGKCFLVGWGRNS